MEKLTFEQFFRLKYTPNMIKKAYIAFVLKKFDGDVTRTAAHLGVTESLIRYYAKILRKEEVI